MLSRSSARSIPGALTAAANRTVFAGDAEGAVDRQLSPEQAARFLGVDEEVVVSLLATILPTVDSVSGPTLPYHDVASLGLNAGLGTSVPEMGLAMMMRFARQPWARLVETIRWHFDIRVEHATDAIAHLRRPLAGADLSPECGTDDPTDDGWSIPMGHDTISTVTGSVTMHGSQSVLENVRANVLYDQMLADIETGHLRFQWISPTGRLDPYARWREGRVDCVCLAAVAASELQRSGLITRVETGRVLGVIDAQHSWVGVLDDDGRWKRFDPLLESHCRRLWSDGADFGTIFRGGAPNALIGWAGSDGAVTAGDGSGAVAHSFAAKKLSE